MTLPHPIGSATGEGIESGAMTDSEKKYGTIVVVGGGCYGSYYLRQLARASRAGAIAWDDVIVVDRNRDCAVTASHDFAEWSAPDQRPTLAVSEWSEFFKEFLGAAATSGGRSSDVIVPSPLMPHLMYEWLLARARSRWPGREVATHPLPSAPMFPWERRAADGTHYVSFAEWICPVNCIEPAICPHTKGDRSWSMPPALESYVGDMKRAGLSLEGPILFHCTHRAYGVGMIDVAAVAAADGFVSDVARDHVADFLIGTVSHCHGALNVLHVG
jgi:hypothetical protein